MTWTKYYEIWKINLVNNLMYMADFVSFAVFILIILFIFVQLWQAIYATKPLIEGFTMPMMIWYLLMTESIVTSQSIIKEISKEIKSGDIAYTLNKPYNIIGYHFAKSLSQFMIGFTITFSIGLILVYSLVGGINISLVSLPFIALAVIFAFSINFLLSAALGLTSFWLEETSGIRFLYEKSVFTIGGMLAPLEIFPRWLSTISAKLPFSYIAYHPAKLFVMFSKEAFIKTVIGQIVYIAGAVIVVAIIYKIAIRKVNIHGG